MSTEWDRVQVGTSLPELKLPAITRTTLALFAGASGDHNPIHIDIDVARSAGLDDVFAHGMLSMAYLGRCLTTWAPQERIRSLNARFAAITPVGAEPVCAGTVVAVETLDERRLATVDLVVQVGSTTTITGRAVVDVSRDVAPPT